MLFGGVIGVVHLVMHTGISFAQDPAPTTEATAPATPADPATEPAAPATADPSAAADEQKAPPKAPPKRDEYTNRPGAPRKQIENYRATKQMSAQPPQGVRLDDLLRGNNPKDPNLDAIAKANVFGITKPGNEADRSIINELSRLADGRGNANSDVVKAYKAALMKYLGQVLDNSVLVQINALNIATEIQNGSNDVSDSVELFLKVLGDEKAQDPVLFMAMRDWRKRRIGA